MLRAVIALALTLAAVCGAVAGQARADGDPASDVLYSQWVFVPADVQASADERARLDGLVQAARAAGLPVKVAVVGSSYDLGSVTALWRKPQLYARFLGTELAFVYRGRLVVVMPNGIAASRAGKPSKPDQALLARVAVGSSLVATAADAVQALAKGHGLTLTAAGAAPGTVAPGGDNGWRVPLALAIGLVLIAAVWAYSLRARPPRWLASGHRRGGKT